VLAELLAVADRLEAVERSGGTLSRLEMKLLDRADRLRLVPPAREREQVPAEIAGAIDAAIRGFAPAAVAAADAEQHYFSIVARGRLAEIEHRPVDGLLRELALARTRRDETVAARRAAGRRVREAEMRLDAWRRHTLIEAQEQARQAERKNGRRAHR
jgi:hypothetical protein